MTIPHVATFYPGNIYWGLPRHRLFGWCSKSLIMFKTSVISNLSTNALPEISSKSTWNLIGCKRILSFLWFWLFSGFFSLLVLGSVFIPCTFNGFPAWKSSSVLSASLRHETCWKKPHGRRKNQELDGFQGLGFQSEMLHLGKGGCQIRWEATPLQGQVHGGPWQEKLWPDSRRTIHGGAEGVNLNGMKAQKWILSSFPAANQNSIVQQSSFEWSGSLVNWSTAASTRMCLHQCSSSRGKRTLQEEGQSQEGASCLLVLAGAGDQSSLAMKPRGSSEG